MARDGGGVRQDTTRPTEHEDARQGHRKTLSKNPSNTDAAKIDAALKSMIKKTVDAAAKGRTPSLGSGDSIGKAVEHYLKETAKGWSAGLKSASPSGGSDLDQQISNLVDKRQFKPGEGRIFYQTNEHMVAALKDLVWIDDPEKVEHLNPLINLLRRQGRLAIATLNYDNGVELLAETRGVACETGIDRGSAAGTFDFSGLGLSLLKLHGSIDWIWEDDVRRPDRPMPQSVIHRVGHEEVVKGHARPAVIFGQRNKLTAEGPFLDLLRAFREELSRSTLLTVIGYSFRDPHINVFISQWLNAAQDHTIRIVNGPGFEGQAVDYARDLLGLRLIAPQQVAVIPHYARPGLIQLYGPFHDASGPPASSAQ
jgi:hypothetical protein